MFKATREIRDLPPMTTTRWISEDEYNKQINKIFSWIENQSLLIEGKNYEIWVTGHHISIPDYVEFRNKFLNIK